MHGDYPSGAPTFAFSPIQPLCTAVLTTTAACPDGLVREKGRLQRHRAAVLFCEMFCFGNLQACWDRLPARRDAGEREARRIKKWWREFHGAIGPICGGGAAPA